MNADWLLGWAQLICEGEEEKKRSWVVEDGCWASEIRPKCGLKGKEKRRRKGWACVIGPQSTQG